MKSSERGRCGFITRDKNAFLNKGVKLLVSSVRFLSERIARLLERKDYFRGRDFLTLVDYTADEISYLLEVSRGLKELAREANPMDILAGKTLGLMFFKPSTRTRISFEVAMYQLGGLAVYLNVGDLQLSRGETIADTARVMSRYFNGLVVRTFDHQQVVELAHYADIPVINGLTDLFHPCQALGDLLTILEEKGRLQGIKLAFVGDGNNVAHSLMIGGAKMGLEVAVASPPGYAPDNKVVEMAGSAGEGIISLTTDPREAVENADVVYTDVWASMGKEAESQERRRKFKDYQVDRALMDRAKPDAIFMHCLPAHRGEEVTDEVMDGPQSRVWDQAENRLHVQKALLALLL